MHARIIRRRIRRLTFPDSGPRTDYLTGPIAVEGAEPGDALCVEILNIEHYESMPWGYTGVFERADGGLFASRFETKAAKAIWDFHGRFCESRHIPGVRFAGITHPGILGTAPSQELLDTWNKREQALIDAHPDACPAVALPPEPKNAYVGQDVPSVTMEKIAREGARTVPGREHGGNCDIKNLSIGARAWLPVYVPGGNLSVGDLHYSQGDLELSFCGAIEMAGIITMRCSVIKGGVSKLCLNQPIFLVSLAHLRLRRFENSRLHPPRSPRPSIRSTPASSPSKVSASTSTTRASSTLWMPRSPRSRRP